MNKLKDKILKLPKVELHLHLDGAVSLELASKLSGLDIEVLKEKMSSIDEQISSSLSALKELGGIL